MIGTTVTLHGYAFSATIHESGPLWCGGPRVDITRDGHHCGTGRWHASSQSILDCSAVLVLDDPEATEEVFDALETKLGDYIDEALQASSP
jgi:hypothetical protein